MVVSSLNISEKLLQRITRTKEVCSGKLFGISGKHSTTIIALQSDVSDAENLEDSFPVQLECCGVFKVELEDTEQQDDIALGENLVLIHRKIKSDPTINSIKNGKLQQVDYTIINEQEINNLFLFVRVTGEFPLQCEFSANALKTAFCSIQKTISSGALVFNVSKTDIFLLGDKTENNVIGVTNDVNISEICDDSNSINEEIVKKKKKITKPRILTINALKEVSKFHKDHAPICILDKNPITALDITIGCDSLLMVDADSKVGDIYFMLLGSLQRSVRLHEAYVLETLASLDKHKTNKIATQTIHFYPNECGHFLALLYPKNASELSLKSKRLLLHKQLLLDTLAPVFRRANQYVFLNNHDSRQPLINPHEGLKLTDNGGTIALVKGKYEYYHYCQNKMDDNGWGCAYRSLQTLASWFKLQGYVERAVPTFSEIQQCLVDIKDKPANFVGSRQWIGSTEVSFVLNTLLGVDNKILYVSSGAEMAFKGPELVSHFQNHGSPIMIGGGVLAHTILGVDYNQHTGNLRFLILDPHYTGGEDLHVIQNKGWCGWKNVDFWNKTSYYNMCLPQVPREV